MTAAPENKKRRRRQGRGKRDKSARGPFLVRHPFSDGSLEERRALVALIGQHEQQKFAELLPAVDALCARINALHAISVLSGHALTATVSDTARHDARRKFEPKVQQGHVELLQALFLRSAWRREAPCADPPDIQFLFDKLPELFDAFQRMRYPQAPAEPRVPEEEAKWQTEHAVRAVQEYLRAHTSMVRNWGYFRHVIRITKQQVAGADALFEAEYGLSLSQLVDLFVWLIRRHEDALNDHRRRMHSVLRASSASAIAAELFTQFPMLSKATGLAAHLAEPGLPLEQAKYAVLPALDTVLPLCFLVAAEDVAEAARLPAEAVLRVLHRVSLGFGDLAETAPETLFLDNPVWTHPLISMGDRIFFCALPQTLASFIHRIIDDLAAPHARLQDKLRRSRAEFLEDRIETLMRDAFPGAALARGFQWLEGDRTYESDLLLRFDDTLLLAEAKSGGVSWPALRGAPGRMVQHIKELIVAPSDQSGRLSERLKAEILGQALPDGSGLNCPVPLDGVNCIIRLSVTLQDFATIQSVPRLLADADLLSSQFPLAPCISLADLEVVLETLDEPVLRLHYLRRRAELLLAARTTGDELDMLGLFLDTGLNLGDHEAGDSQITMLGYSLRIDRHFSRLDEGMPSTLPRAQIRAWVRHFCSQLAGRRTAGWTLLARALLMLGASDQEDVERRVWALMRKLRAGKQVKHEHDSFVIVPPLHRREAVAFHVAGLDRGPPFREKAANISQQAFESDHVDTCTVFSIPCTAEQLQYVGVALMIREDRPVPRLTVL